MSRCAILFGSAGLLAGILGTVIAFAWPRTPGAGVLQAAERPKVDDAQATFEALKKKLPGVVTAWWKEVSKGEESNDAPGPRIALARRISPTKAKISITVKDTRDIVLTFYLWYYDGAWTTKGWEPDAQKEDFKFAMQRLALAIDTAGGPVP
jgi:hypothetical protein